MSTKKQYRLLKDLPDAVVGDIYCHNGSGHYLHMTNPAARSWGKKEVEGLSDWFQPIEQQTQDSFVWTDKLVKEFIVDRNNGKPYSPANVDAYIKQFKASKQQPPIPKEERIEVTNITQWNMTDVINGGRYFKIDISGYPPHWDEKKSQIKQAIEDAINS